MGASIRPRPRRLARIPGYTTPTEPAGHGIDQEVFRVSCSGVGRRSHAGLLLISRTARYPDFARTGSEHSTWAICSACRPGGAGKSTIISLVERLYTPEPGTVEVDGHNITYGDTSFRHAIAYVPQQSVMFDGTIRFNLTLGARPGQTVSQMELEEACKSANIHDTIMQLHDGYDTTCGPNGGRLSGGQKQRLAIARALVRKPQLLILDESTSALDAESERLL